MAAFSDVGSQHADKKDDASVSERVSEINLVPSHQSSDGQRTLWQSIKKYRKVVYITLGLTSPILLYGYDYVTVGTVSAMPAFQYV